MCVSFISSISDIDRADWGKNVQAEFGLDVGYGLVGMRSRRHQYWVQARMYLEVFGGRGRYGSKYQADSQG